VDRWNAIDSGIVVAMICGLTMIPGWKKAGNLRYAAVDMRKLTAVNDAAIPFTCFLTLSVLICEITCYRPQF